MKKLLNPRWEEGREYLRSKIMPRLHEMQRDLFGNEKIHTTIMVGRNGENVTTSVAIFDGKEIKDSIYLSLFCTDCTEYMESEYTKLTDFIKEYTA